MRGLGRSSDTSVIGWVWRELGGHKGYCHRPPAESVRYAVETGENLRWKPKSRAGSAGRMGVRGGSSGEAVVVVGVL